MGFSIMRTFSKIYENVSSSLSTSPSILRIYRLAVLVRTVCIPFLDPLESVITLHVQLIVVFGIYRDFMTLF